MWQVDEAQVNYIRLEKANKQQLNVSLGLLVTAAAAILASVVLGMTN